MHNIEIIQYQIRVDTNKAMNFEFCFTYGYKNFNKIETNTFKIFSNFKLNSDDN